MKNSFLVLLLISSAALCMGQENFASGENLFMQNRPKEAAVYFENAISEDPANVKAYIYLGIAYEQLNQIDEAIAVYRQIIDNAGVLSANVANNLGNAYFKKGSIDEAESMYTQAVAADSLYASAYLGRANARLRNGSLQEAISDYEQFLKLAPRDPQRPQIERLINYIKGEAVEAERKRLAAEEAARAAEERRRKLLDDVASSLNKAANASQGLSSGAENAEGYEGEFELE